MAGALGWSKRRFGLHRYARTTDHRAVVAVSFTRSATEEIRSRVSRQWGLSALTWPHRIVTLDTILNDLLAHLLRSGILQWPGGHQELEVLDTWRSHLPAIYTLDKPVLALNGTSIVTDSERQARRGSYVKPRPASPRPSAKGGARTKMYVRYCRWLSASRTSAPP